MTGPSGNNKILVHPRITRFLHWVLAVTTVTLTITGIYDHYPTGFIPFWSISTNARVTYIGSFIFTFAFIARMYYAFITGEYKVHLFGKKDLKDMIELLKYYFFLQKNHTLRGKYNAGQKLTHILMFFTWLFLIVTGFILYWPDWWYRHFGYLAGLQSIRYYHWLATLFFVGIVPLHVYLAVTEDPAKLQAIFTGYLKDKEKLTLKTNFKLDKFKH